jgi:hypothetical protein
LVAGLASLASCEAQSRPAASRPTAASPAAASRPTVANPQALNDGPYLFHHNDGITAKWVSHGKVQQKQFPKGKPVELPQFAALLGKSLTVRQHKPEAAVWPRPEKLLAISDVEGEYDHMLRFLQANGVVDKSGGWAFGKGHLVCVGDMVDRGQQVTETLWLMYRLSAEARAAGGHLHYVLGNHEAMVMGGDIRYTAQKYKDTAKLFGLPCEGLLGADTELGRWLRSRNALVRVGDLLFVHAGVSASVASQKVDLQELNARIRTVLGIPPTQIKDRSVLLLAWGAAGPLWYRGYFKEHSLMFGPVPTVAALDGILRNLGASSIVVGHTQVPRVTKMFGRRVLAIDTPWTNVDTVQGILVTGDKIQVVDVRGKRTKL